MIEIQESKVRSRAVLAGLNTDQKPDRYAASMEELRQLAEACDLEVVSVVVQNAASVTQKTLLGRGKVEELHAAVLAYDADIVIFQENLTPMQVRNLEDVLDTEVLDRTGIILQIFSTRARTREARLQVKSAQLQYMLPRLAGMRKNLGRQGGGSGRLSNKGAGEEQLELDRRHIERQLAEIRRQLKEVEKERSTQRGKRCRSGLPLVSLVGYTNAGKSTIMNKLLEIRGVDEEKQVFQKDMLFATLDTSIRKINVEGNHDFLLSDTVGFIENLPHALIKAFLSTLEEAINADLILVILDVSDPYHIQQKKITEDTLRELSAENIPKIYVYNKADLLPDVTALPKIRQDEIWISAQNNEGLEELTDLIVKSVYKDNQTLTLLLPYTRGDLLNMLHSKANIISEEYTADGVMVTADCPVQLAGIVKEYEYTSKEI